MKDDNPGNMVSKRESCSFCALPANHCCCQLIDRIENSLPVTIFQHFRENQHPLNTVKLLKRGLVNCAVQPVMDGEAVMDFGLSRAWLLYPGDECVLPQEMDAEKIGNLVVLDGTWRKTKRMLEESQWLQSLPRIGLESNQASINYLRKSSVKNGLSTLEAVVDVLAYIEKDDQKYKSLLNSLSQRVKIQSSYIPEDVLRRNYQI